MRIALIGTRGVPARYGGFETCIEEVGWRLAERGHEVVVYRRRGADEESSPTTYRGMDLVTLPAMHRRSLETLSHTALSVTHAVAHQRPHAAVVFNGANSPFLPLLRARRIPVATHVDGFEWKREKWGVVGQRYYRTAESLAVRWSDALIADAPGIADYYDEEFAVQTELISYGAPSVTARPEAVHQVDLEPRGYHLVVARFEPENHVATIVRGYVNSRAALPLVVVGSAPYANSYTARIQSMADERVRLLGGVWDQELLDQLYANAFVYWHGHSVGGTNPSLLRAVGAGTPTNAFDVSFNRDVLRESGRFWSGSTDVTRLTEGAEDDPDATHARVGQSAAQAARYDWDDVGSAYEDLCRRLANGSLRRPPRRLGSRRPPRGS